MGRVFASSDWHGCGKVANQVLDWLKPDDTLYFIGDAIDRGSDGIAIFDRLVSRPNTYFIKGNHEAMMAEALPSIAKEIEDPSYYDYEDRDLWYGNGGIKTVEPLWEKKSTEVLEYKRIIDKMPLELRYNSPEGHIVILEHAGYSAGSPLREHDPLWDRYHFYDKWQGKDNEYLVHGHTPVQYLKFEYGYKEREPLTKKEIFIKYKWWQEGFYYDPFVIRYCSGHKFDIDLCTIVSGKIGLLDLDTFEEIYFNEEGEIHE